jgi:hypothetical protein
LTLATAKVDAGAGSSDDRAENGAWPEAGKLADGFHLFLRALLPLVDAGSGQAPVITHSLAHQPWLPISARLWLSADVMAITKWSISDSEKSPRRVIRQNENPAQAWVRGRLGQGSEIPQGRRVLIATMAMTARLSKAA